MLRLGLKLWSIDPSMNVGSGQFGTPLARMHAAAVSDFWNSCFSCAAVTSRPADPNGPQTRWAPWKAGELGSRSSIGVVRPFSILTGLSWNSPWPLGSGKSGTPCDRMQFAYASAFDITLVGERACEPPPQPASSPAASSAIATAPAAGRRTRPPRRRHRMGISPGRPVSLMRCLILTLSRPLANPRRFHTSRCRGTFGLSRTTRRLGMGRCSTSGRRAGPSGAVRALREPALGTATAIRWRVEMLAPSPWRHRGSPDRFVARRG